MPNELKIGDRVIFWVNVRTKGQRGGWARLYRKGLMLKVNPWTVQVYCYVDSRDHLISKARVQLYEPEMETIPCQTN